MLVVGLMSGTSADGVDAALVEWPDSGPPCPFALRSFVFRPFAPDFQQRIHDLAAGEPAGQPLLRELVALDVELGERFAAAALAAIEEAGCGTDAVAAIASHGQTVAHHPDLRGTLQIGDPSVIAERTGLTTIADFRARDLAAGGEGAPLAPFFHWEAMRKAGEVRVVLNLGGIANLSFLPARDEPEGVVAFDTGPANSLIDGAVDFFSEGRQRFDRDGVRAAEGQVDAAELARLLDDDFLRRPPPKSTGRERYGRAEARAAAKRWQREGRNPNDLIATLTALTAQSVARAIADFLPAAPERLLVGGGGAANPVMMAGLQRELGAVPVEPFETVGVPSAAAEAMAFSLMGRNALLGEANHLPACTGARRAAVLGELVRA